MVQAAAFTVEAVAPTIFYRKPVCAHTADEEANAKTAGAAVFARTAGEEANAKIAGAVREFEKEAIARVHLRVPPTWPPPPFNTFLRAGAPSLRRGESCCAA